MTASPFLTSKQLIFQIEKIKSISKLRDAIRHNKREIEYELTSTGHIDPSKTHLNYSLAGSDDSLHLLGIANSAVIHHKNQTGKAVRKDAVIAIELLFSISSAYAEIDHRQYFEDCLDWSVHWFHPAPVLSADVHMDESNPHMHIILLCVTPTNLLGSRVVGYKGQGKDRLADFYQQVGSKHGLQMPPSGLSKENRKLLADKVIERIEESNDPVVLSRHYQSVKDAIRVNPTPFAFNLDLDITLKAPKIRTMAQIFTSKGKGSKTTERE
jgi:Plasmid recombination enzyme